MTNSKYHLEPHPEFGFLQIKPTPTPEEITQFYANEFYAAYPKFNDSALEVQLLDKEWLDASREDMCVSVSEIIGEPLAGKKILDIGCGWGQALFYFQNKGMVCYGFDPAPEAVSYANKHGLNVVQAGMEKMDVFEGHEFDVVTLLNVLEHLADPVATLREIKERLLKPKGLLIIDVPNEFNAFQLAGRDVHKLEDWWVAPPGHLNYFSKDTLCNLLANLGYEVKLTKSSFPIEMFLLFGDNYVKDGPLGRQCHERRMAFELNLQKTGHMQVLHKLYCSLAELNLGRQVIAYAVRN
ncbi:methyltransferase domain-containing protein [Scytonema sp. UIC 10036]|uniref:class I SAM-dependent methyltransferase n=1 Tax=Scytonema sp. UIC 10036 TaxID=2304196 RepID=UPI0012DA7F73|nr:class I SAM-dependent methyltransferase [Scytonema sp. UIC 10036]MUG97020.1 methyltransferase domain-containing protein [Scytonema sp. UIC 10036]